MTDRQDGRRSCLLQCSTRREAHKVAASFALRLSRRSFVRINGSVASLCFGLAISGCWDSFMQPCAPTRSRLREAVFVVVVTRLCNDVVNAPLLRQVSVWHLSLSLDSTVWSLCAVCLDGGGLQPCLLLRSLRPAVGVSHICSKCWFPTTEKGKKEYLTFYRAFKFFWKAFT